jgi:hypothetical protein
MDQPTNDFDEWSEERLSEIAESRDYEPGSRAAMESKREHGEDASSVAYDAEREAKAEKAYADHVNKAIAFIDARAKQGCAAWTQIDRVAQRHPGLASALISEQLAWRHLRNAVMEAIGFLDSQADADHSDVTGRGEPNHAMSLRDQLTESLTRYTRVK